MISAFFCIPGTAYGAPAMNGVNVEFAAKVIADAAKPPLCACGTRMLRNGFESQRVIDAPAFGNRIIVNIKRQRYRCAAAKCGTMMRPIDGVEPKARLSKRAVAFIESRAPIYPFAALAEETGVDRTTVQAIFSAYAAPVIARNQAEFPRVLGIDEVYIAGRYYCTITDIERSRPYELLPAHNHETVLPALAKIRAGAVAIVVMDMSDNFRAAVRAAFPGVVIVADRFHLIKYVNRKLDAYRVKRRKELEKEKRQARRRKRKSGEAPAPRNPTPASSISALRSSPIPNVAATSKRRRLKNGSRPIRACAKSTRPRSA